jgi:hypothetical protein
MEGCIQDINVQNIMGFSFLENVIVYSRNTLRNMLQWLYYMVDIIQILLADGHSVYQQESQELRGQHVMFWA